MSGEREELCAVFDPDLPTGGTLPNRAIHTFCTLYSQECQSASKFDPQCSKRTGYSIPRRRGSSARGDVDAEHHLLLQASWAGSRTAVAVALQRSRRSGLAGDLR
jgi:hypothetical protein